MSEKLKRRIASASARLIESISSIKVGEGLPVRTLVDLDSELGGKDWFNPGTNDYDHRRDIFIEFWSSQSEKKNRKNIRKMRRLYDAFGDQLQILSIHIDVEHVQKNNDMETFLRQENVPYPVGVYHEDADALPSTIWERFAFTHLPHGLLLNGRTHQVKWSGSLVTHNVEHVIHRRYGKSHHTHKTKKLVTTDEDDDDTLVTATTTSSYDSPSESQLSLEE